LTLPNFFIIGAAKAGTTSLHHYLDQHPQVQMSAIKEPNFFAGPPNGIPYPVGRVDCLEDYERLFDPAFERRGEASPSYTNAPRRRGVPERIREMLPEARFVYLVRDPISRLVSQHQMLFADGDERKSLRDAVRGLDDADPHSYYLTCQSFYARQLELYLAHFPQERILVVDQAELRHDRRGTLREVFAFLAVDPDFSTPEFDAELFQGAERRVYPRSFKRVIRPLLRGPYHLLPRRLRGSLRASAERRFLSPAPAVVVDEETRARLVELFMPDVERLRSLTGNDFASWSI
jgi:Sulfotransferase family